MLCKITLSDRHCLKTEHTGLDLTVISTLPPNASSQQIFRLDAEIQNKDAGAGRVRTCLGATDFLHHITHRT